MSHDTAITSIAADEVTIPPGHALTRVPMIAGGVAVLGVVLSLFLRSGDPKQFAFSWLVAFLFFLSLSVGALYFVLIHFATQAGWGIVVRRLAENATAVIPVFAVLFLPILAGMDNLFPWIHEIAAGKDHVLAGKAPYLNPSFFIVRAAVSFTCWSAIAWLYLRASRAQDQSKDRAISVRLRRWSGPAIIVLALTQTFAAVDWIMSIDPHWYSTIFGVYWFAGSFVSFFAFLTLLVVRLKRANLLTRAVGIEHFHDLGKMLFAFVVFWAYIGFSQFFLIWYGNIPEETIFFRLRLVGSWKAVSLFLAFGHFIVPFFYLMPRTIKRTPPLLALGAAWVLLMHLLDIYWLIMPAMHPGGASIGLSDVAALLAVGGTFVAVLFWMLRGAPLVPVGDPRLPESLSFENF